MSKDFRSLLPPLLLAAGIIGATLVSLRSSASLLWALAGLGVLAATTIAAGMLRKQNPATTAILAGAVVLAGLLIAMADPKYVPAMMPILGSCASGVLLPSRCATTFQPRT